MENTQNNQHAPTRIIIAEIYRGHNILHKQSGNKYFFAEGMPNQHCNKIESCRKVIDSRINPSKVGLPNQKKINQRLKLKNQVAQAIDNIKNGY